MKRNKFNNGMTSIFQFVLNGIDCLTVDDISINFKLADELAVCGYDTLSAFNCF